MYVDGFIVAVKTARKEDYIRIAREAAVVFKEHGALSIVEAWADDVAWGELTSFPRAVHLEEDETCVFSWITYPDRATRDACVKATMADERLKGDMANMPFDGKRMIWGGFEAIVEA